MRGVSRSSRTRSGRSGGRDGNAAHLAPTNDAVAYGQVAWSWHPDADAALVRKHHAQNGDQKARRTGEHAKQPLRPSRGECRLSAEPVVTAACLFSAGGPWVAACSPAFPAPSIYCEGKD